MKKTVMFSIVALLLVASVAAAGVMIRSSTVEGGLNDVGYFEYQDGDTDGAEAAFLAALKENPDYERARYNLATLYFEQQRYEEAIEQLEILLSIDNENPQYHFDWAVNVVEVLRRDGSGDLAMFDAAIAAYERADELVPGFPHALENVAVLERVRALALA